MIPFDPVETFRAGGFIMWPLLAIALGVLVLAGRAAHALFVRAVPSERVEGWLAGLLFWGTMAVVLGAIGTFGGISQAAAAISAAGGASAALVWGAIRVALITLIFGLVTFFVAGLLWFALRQRYVRVELAAEARSDIG